MILSDQSSTPQPRTERRIRVAMVIDHLGPGGAERQFVMLAKALRDRAFEVSVIIFQPEQYAAAALVSSGIQIVSLQPRNVPHLVYLMHRQLRRLSPDVVIAFLKWSSLIVELASLPKRKFAIIASERNLDRTGIYFERYIRYALHRLADVVVCNAFAQQNEMRRVVPFLSGRIEVIVNGVDLDYFRPSCDSTRTRADTLHILVLARYSMQKNPFGFLEAVAMIATESPQLDFVVDWYGQVPEQHNRSPNRLRAHHRSVSEAIDIYDQLGERIRRQDLDLKFRLHNVRRDVVQLYRKADVVCLPSFYEGCSNVIGEALACGVPVLASRVSDNERMVQDGRTGFLFDPSSPREIANSIIRFSALSPSVVREMALESRKIAETTLSPKVLGDSFASLIKSKPRHGTDHVSHRTI